MDDRQNRLKGKKIILGITGSIAAYKSAMLCRLFVKQGCEVKVLMTPAAKAFISPLTLSTLSKNEVLTHVLSEDEWNNHVELGLWADCFIIAPATANTIAKMAHGICDQIISAVYLSARCPVLVAPAMDVDMWQHPSTQRNIELLLSDHVHLIDVQEGELASGLYGKGRMAEPENILEFVANVLDSKQDFLGKRVLVTAGPTYEALDPVRFLGNWSSGKMGAELAKELAKKGAKVNLILGPSPLTFEDENITIYRVISAQEMYEKCTLFWKESDIGIMAAAVADYRPQVVSSKKIKKSDDHLMITLERTPDIAKSLGQSKSEKQLLIGFALETDAELENAKRKLNEKKFDFIVLNSLREEGAGFGVHTNKIRIVDQNENISDYSLKSKNEVAKDIVDYIILRTDNPLT